MIDLQAHIVPGIDDGPLPLERGPAMPWMAARAGRREIVATPHRNGKHPLQPALVQRRCEWLPHLAGGLITIRRGYELELAPEAVRRVPAAPRRFTIL